MEILMLLGQLHGHLIQSRTAACNNQNEIAEEHLRRLRNVLLRYRPIQKTVEPETPEPLNPKLKENPMRTRSIIDACHKHVDLASNLLVDGFEDDANNELAKIQVILSAHANDLSGSDDWKAEDEKAAEAEADAAEPPAGPGVSDGN